MNEKLTLNLEEAGKLLGISRQTVYLLSRREDFPVLRIGRRILIPRKQLEAWMDRNVTGVEGKYDQAG